MGGGGSKEKSPPEKAEEIVQWKVLPTIPQARAKYELDGSLGKSTNPLHVELRALLDEQVGQRTLGKLAKERHCLDIFMCWVDIQEFKTIPTIDYRRSKAINIFNKYIKPGAVLQVGGLDGSDVVEITSKIESSKTNPLAMTNAFFDDVQNVCFLEIFQNVFQPFKDTQQYFEMTQQFKEAYNNVRTDDFEYMDKLGEGGFGLVVHAKKISTGKHYAMKIQSKKSLLDCFADDPRRASDEKLAISTLHHPFIVAMDYAFQTTTLAVMVLSLGTGGDLFKALMAGDNMSEDRVRFYAAEIVLALGYMHEMGLMYRDLKPHNVLLNVDGHIQLVDMGGVLDETGKVFDYSGGGARDGLSTLFAQCREDVASSLQAKIAGTDDVGASTHSKRPKNRMSIMGTFGCQFSTALCSCTDMPPFPSHIGTWLRRWW